MKKISKILFKISWLVFCFLFLFLNYLEKNGYETKIIILCIVLYSLVGVCLYIMSLVIEQEENAEEQKERYKKLISRLKIKSFVYEDAETNSLYIEKEDLPEIIDFLYELQMLGGVIDEKDDN